MRRNWLLTNVRGRGALTKGGPCCDGLARPDRAVGLAANRGSVAACPSIGPAKAIRPSVGGGAAGAGAMTARAWGGVGAAGAPTAGGVGRTAVTVAYQPRADRGLAAAGPPLAGTWVATADGEGFGAALARMALGRQRPSSLRRWFARA